jgi:tRNA U34 5-carboxymethylaminomethyl modifying GTPase MnmE/TrmE
MADPIVFISKNRILKGKLDEFRKHYQSSVQNALANKPDTMIEVTYENEDSSEVTIIRIFKDADGLDRQIEGAEERSRKTYEMIQPVSIEIFGQPNPGLQEKVEKIAGSGVTVKSHPIYTGGFFRKSDNKE